MELVDTAVADVLDPLWDVEPVLKAEPVDVVCEEDPECDEDPVCAEEPDCDVEEVTVSVDSRERVAVIVVVTTPETEVEGIVIVTVVAPVCGSDTVDVTLRGTVVALDARPPSYARDEDYDGLHKVDDERTKASMPVLRRTPAAAIVKEAARWKEAHQRQFMEGSLRLRTLCGQQNH